jgi:hypothetical protein
MQHIFAQEVERNRSASVEGTIIPGEWVMAAIDAHERLHFEDDGLWGAGLDVADGGGDLNALAVRKGPVLKTCDEWGERDTGGCADGFPVRKFVSAKYGTVAQGFPVRKFVSAKYGTVAQAPVFGLAHSNVPGNPKLCEYMKRKIPHPGNASTRVSRIS